MSDGIPRCKSCKHFALDKMCEGWGPEYDENAVGECVIMLGIDVEIRIDTGPWGSGGAVDEVTVGALFGCTSHEPRDEP